MLKLRKFLIFSLITLLAFLFVACGEDDDDLFDEDGTINEGSWLNTLKPGSWSEYVSPDGYRTRMEYLGDDTWLGRKCMLLEYESSEPGEAISIMQIWFDKTNMESVVMFIKEGNEVYRWDITQYPEETVGEQEWEKSTSQKIGTDKYTTPTGKTVKATKYLITDSYGTSEYWVSSEVPFAQVKEIYNGELEFSLYDFGSSGAVRSISKKEAENAKPFDFGGWEPGNGDEEPGNIPDGGDTGNIKITVGAGARPTITVSKPIKYLTIMGDQVFWGFEVPDPPGSLAGPFKYGVIPAGAEATIENSPDLVAGETYQITVFGPDFEKGNTADMGIISFTR